MVRAAILSSLTLLACAASAQFGFGGRNSMSLLESGSGYLMVPSVQKELGISPATAKKISDKYMASMQGLMNPSANSKPDKASMEAQMKKIQQAQSAAVAMLNPAQKARLKQITIQQLGAGAMLNPEVKKSLGLNATQEQRITAIVRDGSMQMFSSLRNNGGASANKPEDMQKRMTEFAKKQEEWKKKMLAESMKSLKPDQQAKWKAMQGKPFKIDMMGAMRGIAPMGGGAARPRGGKA